LAGDSLTTHEKNARKTIGNKLKLNPAGSEIELKVLRKLKKNSLAM